MSEQASTPAGSDIPPAGLQHSLRALIAGVLAAVRTRGELLQTELAEERLRVAGIVALGVAAAVFLTLGVLLLSVFLILFYWDTHRVLVAGLLALAYLVIGMGCALIARQRSQTKSRLFAASLAELAKDEEQLTRP